jgi:hypothetical protein
MTRKSCRPRHLLLLLVVAALVAHALGVDSSLMAQAPGDIAALRAQLDRRFDVLPLQDGVLLRPRVRINDVRSIEVHQGSIALDGLVVTGAELRQRLGADSDMVVRVSYLSPADQRTLTGTEQPGTPAPAVGAIASPLPPEPLDPREARERARDARQEARERARDVARGRFGRRGGPGDRVRFGGTVVVNEGETVDGDVVVIAGTARVNGRVNGEVVVVGGTADLGPNADIAEDVVVIGGPLRRDPAARIGGDVDEIGFGPININPNLSMPRFGFGNWNWGNSFGSAFSLLSTVIRVAVMCLLAALVLLFGSGYVDRIRVFAAAEPFKAGAVGFLSQVLMLPLTVILIIVLVITIVGIPLLLLMPFVLLALCVLGLVGFTAVARQVGDLVVGRFSEGGIGVYAATMAGVILIVSPLLLGRLISVGGGPLWLVSTPLAAVGFFVEYAAWTIGFGAVLFSTFGRRLPMTPPPLP